jgi:catechol 2,3-dioxygenase-like lactoylglutathione lyase family enzyme
VIETTTRACAGALLLACGLGAYGATEPQPSPGPATVTLRSVALRVHNMDAMRAFYREAFGVIFRPVDTGGLASHFGEVNGVTLKFVPIRAAADFTGFPVHQLGFGVADIESVAALAEKHGGRRESRPVRDGGRLHAAIRDPDGNTVEVYQDVR